MLNFRFFDHKSGPPEKLTGADTFSFLSNLQLKRMKNFKQTFTFLTLILMSFCMNNNILAQGETISYSPAPSLGFINICSGGEIVVTINSALVTNQYELRLQPDNIILETKTAISSTVVFNSVVFNIIGSGKSLQVVRSHPPFELFSTQSVQVHSDPTAPTLTLSPATSPVCAGTNLSATLNAAGSDANANVPGTNSYDYRINGGAWIPYGLGNPISTTTYMLNTVEIRAKRSNDALGCSAENIYTWNINSNVHDNSGALTGSYCTIQQAIDAANTESGDVLVVEAGTYTEEITLNKAITIQGANQGISAGAVHGGRGAESIVDGGFIVSAAATIDGLKIINGRTSGLFKVGVAVATSGVTVTNCIIQDVLSPAQSDGLSTQPGNNNLILTNSKIFNNWRGIYLNPGSGHVITGNLIDGNNLANSGVGIGSDGQSNLTLTGNIISNHPVEGWGASAVGSGVVATGNDFSNNGISIAHYGGNPINASCSDFGSNTYSVLYGDVKGAVVFVPYIEGGIACTGTNAVLANLIVNYTQASENVVVTFDVSANSAVITPIPGLNPAVPADYTAIVAKYTALNIAIANNDAPAILAAALALGDDIITEYYYFDNSNTKVYLQTAGGNDLVKTKYWDKYLNNTTTAVQYPNFTTTLFEVPIGNYSTSTNPLTPAVDAGWLNDALGRDLYVKVTLVHNGSVSSIEESVAIPAGPVNVYSAEPFSPATWVSSHLTIQAAINATSTMNGYFVKVDAGTYSEAVVINKEIKLLGANANVSCTGSRGPESIINPPILSGLPAISLGAGIGTNNVTINGFEITGTLSNSGIYCGGDGPSNLTIRFNNIHHIGTARGSNNVYAINYRVGANNTSNVNLSDNCIDEVLNGTNSAEQNSAAIWVGQSNANGVVSNLTIERNMISNVKSGRFDKAATGISLEAAWGVGTGGINGAIVKDNTIQTVSGGIAYGIQLTGKTPNTAVQNNKIDNVSSPFNPAYAVGVTVPLTNTGASTVSINNNSFTNATFAIFNGTAVNLNATCNWYGSASGNVITTKISGTINYISWLVNGTNNASSTGFFQTTPDCSGTSVFIASATPSPNQFCQNDGSVNLVYTGGTGTYTVAWTGGTPVSGIAGSPYNITGLTNGNYTITVTDINGTWATTSATVSNLPVRNNAIPAHYATIQAAIDAASPGHTIEVCAGNYPEIINVNKNLTINGPNVGVAGTAVRNPEAVIMDGKLNILGNNTVTFDGFKFAHVSNSTPVSLGGGAVATIQNNIIERNATAPVMFGPTSARGIEISNGAGIKSIKNNKFTGDVSGGVFSGTLSWNSGMFLNGPASVINIENNLFENCRTALNIDDVGSGISVSGNTFQVSGTAISYGGASPGGQFTLGMNNDFKSTIGTLINLSTVATSFRLNVTSSTYNLIPFSSYSINDLFTIEAKMFHRGVGGRNGLVTYVTNNQYVIPVNNSIQLAVDYAPVSGHTINVAPGTNYPANISVNGKSLTIQGQGCDDVTGTTIDGLGTVLNGISVLTNTTGVIIKNLKIKNTVGGSNDAGIRVHPGCNGLIIEDVCLVNTAGRGAIYVDGPVDGVTIDDCEVSGTGVNGRGITVWNGFKENITITGNNVHDIGGCCGIELQDGNASGVTMDGNTVTNVGDSGMSAIGLNGSTGANSISGNTITNTGRFGIEVKNPNGNGASLGIGSIVVSGNIISRTIPIVVAQDIAGIALMRRGVSAGNVDIPTGVYVTGNMVSGYTQPSTSEGFGIVVAGTNHTVTGNTVSGNDIGIQQQAGHLPYPADGDQSNLADQYFGRDNTQSTCGNTISGNTLSANGVDERNVPASLATIGTVINTNTSKIFCTIQSAINDVSTLDGHTLQISAETFNENVSLTKRLTLNGAGIANTTIDGSINMTAPDHATERMTLSNLQVIATTGILEGDTYYAIRLNSTTSNIAPVTFNNVKARSRIDGSFVYGTGLLITPNGNTIDDVNIQNCDLSGSYTHGIYLKNTNGNNTGAFTNFILKNTTVDNNSSKPIGSGGDRIGMYLAIQPNANPNILVENITIENCSFNNHVSNAAGVSKGIYSEAVSKALFKNVTATGNGREGIDLNLKFRNYSDITFEDCNVSGNGTTWNSPNLHIKARNDGGTYGPNPASITDLNIKGGTFSSNDINKPAISIGNNVSDINMSDGVTINGSGGVGLVLYTSATTPEITLGNTSFAGTLGAFIANTSGVSVDAKSATFSGLTGMASTTTENYAIEDKILHKVDNSAYGHVEYFDAKAFVTPNSFISPATTSPSVQRAIDVVDEPGTVHIQSGTTYTGGMDASGKDIDIFVGESPACVIIGGDMILDNMNILDIDLNGTTACTQYDQYTVNGMVTLGGATLSINLGLYMPDNGDSYMIISNDGTDAVVGEFAQGYSIDISGQLFQISYTGNDGNDVVLTRCAGGVVNTSVMPNKTFCSIQDAIDDPSTLDDHIITVAAGTYAEQLFVYKKVDLRGPNYGMSANGTRNPEAIIVPPANLINMALTKPEQDNGAYLVVFYNDKNGIKMDGFTISGDNTNINGFAYAGMNIEATYGVWSIGLDDIEFKNNIVQNFTYMGFIASNSFGNSSSNLTLSNNKINNIHDLNASGFGFGAYIQATGGLIINNVITNVRNGIQVQPYTAPAGGTVSNNTFTAYGLGMFYNYAENGNGSWTMENNSITGVNAPGSLGGPIIWSGVSVQTMNVGAGPVTIQGNFIDAGTVSIPSPNYSDVIGYRVRTPNNNAVDINNFTNNSITNVETLIHNQTAQTVNATCNWWGTATFNDIQPAITGPAAFVPYLIDNGDELAFGFQPTDDCDGSPIVIGIVSSTPNQFCQSDGAITVNFSGGTANYRVDWSGAASGGSDLDLMALTVAASPYTTPASLPNGNYTVTVTDANGSTASTMVAVSNLPVRNNAIPAHYATIQAAIDAASPGHTIEVCAGNYPEIINVNKNLTINGPNVGVAGTAVRNPEAVIVDGKLNILGNNTVTFDGFKFAHVSNSTPVSLGGGAVATIQNNIIERNAAAPIASPGPVLSRGIEISNGTGAKVIKNNLFTGDASGGFFSGTLSWNSGMFVNGPLSVISIDGNTFENCRTAMNIDDLGAGINLVGNTFETNGTHLSFGGTSPVTGTYTFGANDFKPAASVIINLNNVVETFRLDITAGSYNGVHFAALSDADKFAVESQMWHKDHQSRKGKVIYVAGNQYVNNINLVGPPVFNKNDMINNSIKYADPNDIINLQAGTYNQKVVINKSNLTLRGITNDKTQYIIDGTGITSALLPGSGIVLNSGISGITIKNLTVQNFTGTNGNAHAGIYGIQNNNNLLVDTVALLNNTNASGFYANGLGSGIDNVTVRNSMVSNNGGSARGIVIWNGLKTNINISYNNLLNNRCCGIELSDGNASAVTIRNNTIDIGNGDNAIGLIGLNPSAGPNLIHMNTITGGGRFGIEIKNPAGGVTVSNNSVSLTTVDGDRRDRAGIAVFRRDVLNNNVDVPNGVTVSGNTVNGYVQDLSYDEGFGIVIEGTNHTVTGNTISNCNVGIQQQGGAHPNANYPAGNGDQGTPLQASTASLNYFGRGNSPFACGNLIDNTNSFSGNGTNTRNVISANNLGLVTNTSNGETFCNIQAAIDDAQTVTGHTLTVAAGTYAETINLNKSVTLRGPNHSLVPCVDTRVAEAIITGGLNVTAGITMTVVIEGFHFQGVSSPFNYNGNIGTTTLTATFRNNLVNSSSGQMAAFVGATDNANLTISNNCFQNMASNAMQLGGGNFVTQITGNIINTTVNSGINTDAIINSNISNNTISNTGQQGIQVAGFSSNVNVFNNVITNANTTLGVDRGGIRIRGTNYTGPVDISNNIISGSLNGIAVANGENITGKMITVNDNKLSGNTASVYHGGTGSLNAECNWHGSVNHNLILAQLAGSGASDIDFVSYLSNDFDTDGAMGFQPSLVACSGTPVVISATSTPNQYCQTNGSITVDLSGGLANYRVDWSGAASGASDPNPLIKNVTGPSYVIPSLPNGNYTITVTDTNGSSTTTAVAVVNLPVWNSSVNSYHATIQAAIDAALPTHIIEVCAGTYVENVVVNKSLTINGPNANVDPRPDVNARTAEAIVMPAVNDATNGRVFNITADNVTINGFTVDGDNPSLSGGIANNGADINTQFGIGSGTWSSGTGGKNGMLVRYNIVKNVNDGGIYGNGGGTPAEGGLFSYNRIDNSPWWGIVMETNCYTDIRYNRITRVTRGVQFDNYYTAKSSGNMVVEYNDITYLKRGILQNLFYSNGSLVEIKNNTLTADVSPQTENVGLLYWSIDTGITATATNNTINANEHGARIWNCQGNVSVNGGTISGGQIGVYATTTDVYGNGSVQNASVNNVTITGSLASGDTGVKVYSHLGGIGSSLTVNNCQITGHDTGITTGGADAGGIFTGNAISAGVVGINVTNATLPLTVTGNGITLTSQVVSSLPTVGIALNNISGTAATIGTNNIGTLPNVAGPYYGYTIYNLNTTPVTNITGGKIYGVMQGVSAFNSVDNVNFAPSVFNLNSLRMSGFTGNHGLANINFHAGVYTFTGGVAGPNSITANIADVSVNGTGRIAQDCAGLSFADFSTGAGTMQNIKVRRDTLTENLNRGINIRGNNALIDISTSTLDRNGRHGFNLGNIGFGLIARQGAVVTIDSSFIINPEAVTDLAINVSAIGADPGSAGSVSVTATHNSIIQNTNATSKLVNNAAGGTVNATCNWWGSAVAANVTPHIAGVVTYQPFLTTGTDVTPLVAGFQPVPNSCNACISGVLNTNTNISYCTIQQAINDINTLNGHTITVAGSTYTENVIVSKALTITGANAGTAGCASRVAESTVAGGLGTAFNISTSGVTIDGFEITGATGVVSVGATNVAVRNNKISVTAIGVNAQNIATSAGNTLTLEDNCITLSSQLAGANPTTGVFVSGATGSDAVVMDDNTVSGAFYGYVLYGLNTTAASVVSDGTVTGAMQGVAIVNTLDGTTKVKSNVAVSGMTMSGFFGAHPSMSARNFHAGIYTFTTAGTLPAEGITLSVAGSTINGTQTVTQASGGIYLADFSGLGATVQTVTVDESNIINNTNRGLDARGRVAVTVTESTFTNNGGAAFGSDGNDGFTMIAQQGATINATNNFITHPATSTTPVTAFLTGNGPSNTIIANNNSILKNGNANGRGATNVGGSTIDATCNWWGTTLPSAVSALMMGTVSRVTWLISGVDGNLGAAGFQPSIPCEVCVPGDLAGCDISGSAIVVQNSMTTATIAFTGIGGTAPYTFTYNVSYNAGPAGPIQTVTTISGDVVTVVQPNSVLGTFKYSLVSVTEANGCTYVFPVPPTETITIIPATALPDLSPIVARPSSSVLQAPLLVREGYVQIKNGGGGPTFGPTVFRISKDLGAIGFTVDPLMMTSAGSSVVNHLCTFVDVGAEWEITYPYVVPSDGISVGSNIKLGFVLDGNAANNGTKSTLTVTVINGTGGGDSTEGNNKVTRTYQVEK